MHKYIFYTNTIFKGVFILVSVNLYSTNKIGMGVSLDPGILINITDYNADLIIKYMFERFPY